VAGLGAGVGVAPPLGDWVGAGVAAGGVSWVCGVPHVGTMAGDTTVGATTVGATTVGATTVGVTTVGATHWASH
jgi:hypothetical protein